MRIRKICLFLVICLLTISNSGFAKEEKLACDRIYLLSSYLQDLDLYRLSSFNINSQGFLISARSCKIDLNRKKLFIDKFETISMLPYVGYSIYLKSLSKLDIDLSGWNAVLIFDSVDIEHIYYRGKERIVRKDTENYLTIYGNTDRDPAGVGVYTLITPRFRYN